VDLVGEAVALQVGGDPGTDVSGHAARWVLVNQIQLPTRPQHPGQHGELGVARRSAEHVDVDAERVVEPVRLAVQTRQVELQHDHSAGVDVFSVAARAPLDRCGRTVDGE
jgi:hypothetical protein